MSRIRLGVMAVGTILLGVVGVMAQLPDNQPPQSAPPPAPGNVVPGNIDLNRVNRQATPFQAEAPQMQAPATVVRDGNTYTVSPSIVGTLPTPSYGYIHQFGSFQITRNTAEGMFMLSATLPFPDGRRTIDFYHASFRYYGRYTDPGTNISGYLYVTDIGPPVNDKRYILFGDQNLNVQDPNSNGTRWVVYYNGTGTRVYYTTARFYMP